MKPYNSTVYTCPHCGTQKAVFAIALGNTFFGVTVWSDAKRYSPMMQHASYVQRCPGCKHYYVTRTTPHFTAYSIYSYNKGELPYPNLKEALSELMSTNMPEQDEYVVRLMVLHAYNDLYGTADEMDIPVAEREYIEENILKMLPLSKDPILQAELYREIGDFEQCKNKLSKISPKSEFGQGIIDSIRFRCLQKDSTIFLISGTSERFIVESPDDEAPYNHEQDMAQSNGYRPFDDDEDEII